MWRVIRWLFGLFFVAAAALVGYAYIVDLEPPEGTAREPVAISAN